MKDSSPSGPDDSEYIDLLLEYTQIKKQLETIRKEEAKAEKILTGPEDADKSKQSKATETPVLEGKNILRWHQSCPFPLLSTYVDRCTCFL